MSVQKKNTTNLLQTNIGLVKSYLVNKHDLLNDIELDCFLSETPRDDLIIMLSRAFEEKTLNMTEIKDVVNELYRNY